MTEPPAVNEAAAPQSPLPADPAADADGPLDLRRRDVHTRDVHTRDVHTRDVGRTFDDGAGRVFPCESCGADLEFHIGTQSLKCPWCGHVREILPAADDAPAEQDFDAMLAQVLHWREERKRQAGDNAPDDAAGALQELRCESCGGNVEFIGTLTSTSCPYCSAPVQLEHAHTATETRIPVDGVLPFQIDRRHAQASLGQWLRSRWFAPNDFRTRGTDEKFNGVYLSFFTFDAMTSSSYSGQRGEYYYVTVGSGKNQRSERRTRWYPASGSFQRFFDDILVLANTGLRRDFMLALEPWPLQKVVAFDQRTLAGFLARTYDVDLDQCFTEARLRIDAALHTEVCQRIGGDTQQIDSIRTRCEAITFKHLLLPTWLLACRYRGKSYQVFINAATGEVQGERPWSVWKILFAAVTAAVIGAVIWSLSQDSNP